MGATTNSTRTPEQTELANFYRSEYLCPVFQNMPRDIAKAQTKSIDDSSRLLALVSYGDGRHGHRGLGQQEAL